MKIDQLRVEPRGPLVRAAATVRWEDADRPVQEIYYEVPAEYGEAVSAGAEAFLTVCVLPAMRAGERRVAVNGEVCPELHEGLQEAMAWIVRWKSGRRAVRLEVDQGCRRDDGVTRVAGSLLSGGVDGLALLRFNHLRYPEGHPRRIELAMVARGLWGVEPVEDADAERRLRRAEAALAPVTRAAGITLIPIFTNLQNLSEGDMPFWQHEYQGAALASFGHVLRRRLNVLSIASTWDVNHLEIWGSHPVLDHNYGSHDLAIRHEMARWSRPAKLRLLADWTAALRVLRVCNRQPEADLNCGRCEKCLRTMLTLLALGVLDQADTFEFDDLTPDQLRGIVITHPDVEGDYRETSALLRRAGRAELARAIERRLRVSPALRQSRRLRAGIHDLDARFLGGAVSQLRTRRRSVVPRHGPHDDAVSVGK